MAAKNINSFSLSQDEKLLFAGTFSGEILILDPKTFETIDRFQAHFGSIEAMATHPVLPFVASYGKDRRIRIFSTDTPGKLVPLHDISTLHITPGDGEQPFPSTSQALFFHDRDAKLVGHSANGGLTELAFDREKWELVRCTRAHGKFDIVTARYLKDSDAIMSASVRGEVAIHRDGVLERKWDLGAHNNWQAVHWFEHVRGDEYLIASDGRHVIRLDVSGKSDPIIGPFVARDHLEYVTYNEKSDRAWCSSFDRRIYEIDPDTCVQKKVTFQAPFKNRWIKSLKSDPSSLIVQCRNGALYRVDVDTGRVAASINETPDALWTGTVLGKTLYVSGEGDAIRAFTPIGEEPTLRLTQFAGQKVKYAEQTGTYAKRMVVSPSGALLALGRTDGTVFVGKDAASLKEVARFPEAVRDVTFGKDDDEIFVASEDARIYRMTPDGKREILFENTAPVWALAYNAKRRLLAIGSRIEKIDILDLESNKTTRVNDKNRFCKRMKWCDDDRLLISNSGIMNRYSVVTEKLEVLQPNLPNTAEDFDWDEDQRYLVLATYSRLLFLLDFESGKQLDVHATGIGYTKGILFLPKSVRTNDYAADFVTFGRDGTVALHRVHDDRVIAQGPLPIEA